MDRKTCFLPANVSWASSLASAKTFSSAFSGKEVCGKVVANKTEVTQVTSLFEVGYESASQFNRDAAVDLLAS